jgi:hypothetical protein
MGFAACGWFRDLQAGSRGSGFLFVPAEFPDLKTRIP